MDTQLRPCKFGAVECTWSDLARADCYVCQEVRTALNTLSRLQRENFALNTRVRELENELQTARAETSLRTTERDIACDMLHIPVEAIVSLVASNGSTKASASTKGSLRKIGARS